MKYLFPLFFLLFSKVNAADAQEIDILSGIKIRMRDGILLNATIYKPHEQKLALPVVLQVTPYISDNYHSRGVYFSRNSYVYVVADSRGRGSSEGIFDPFMQEAKDGFDAVEWAAAQPFCNGKVGMWGGSYSGYNQWATAKELPPHLKTIVPAAAVKPGIDFPMQQNIGAPYALQWLANTSGKTANDQLFEDSAFWNTRFATRFKYDIAFKDLDSIAGYRSTVFQNWAAHAVYDDYYKKMSPTQEQYADMNIPVLTITGYYDDDQEGALTYYREFMRYAPTAAAKKHYLVIGPWDHAGTRTPGAEVGGLRFGDSSLLDMNALHKQWYDFTLKDSSRPSFLRDKFVYFISNKNTWKYLASLYDAGKNTMSLYLQAGADGTNDLFHSGRLQKIAVDNPEPGKYTYEPLNKTFEQLDFGMTGIAANYLSDQRLAYRLKEAGAIYHSDVFEKETELTGFFELRAFIETDVKDVDIMAAVYEIKADGTCALLTTETLRARYRDGLEKEKLLQPGTTHLFDFNHFPFVSRAIEKGSRLRLLLTSPNSMYVQKNYCSGGNIVRETSSNAHTAHIKIHNDRQNKSVLILPVVND